MAKPHIAKLMTTGRWCCSTRKTEPGFGATPILAFQDWKQENIGRYIDLDRYAGTYGGTRPDRDVSIYVSWWSSICDYGKQIAIGFLIAAAATCWVASWMLSR